MRDMTKAELRAAVSELERRAIEAEKARDLFKSTAQATDALYREAREAAEKWRRKYYGLVSGIHGVLSLSATGVLSPHVPGVPGADEGTLAEVGQALVDSGI